MIDNRSPREEYALRFGEIVVDRGFISIWQLQEALTEQLSNDYAGNSHKLIGEILFEKGWITLNQIESVMEEVFKKNSFPI